MGPSVFFIAQRRSYCRAELGVFRDNEVNLVEFLKAGEDKFALGQQGKVPDKHIFANTRVERCEDTT